jgi:hypothetical protein
MIIVMTIARVDVNKDDLGSHRLLYAALAHRVIRWQVA